MFGFNPFSTQPFSTIGKSGTTYNKLITYLSISAVLLNNKVFKALTYAATIVTVLVKGFTKTLTTTLETSTTTLAKIATHILAISYTAAESVVLNKQVKKLQNIITTSLVNITKTFVKLLSIVQHYVVTLGVARPLLLTLTLTSTVTLKRSVGKILQSITTGIFVIAKAFTKTLSLIQTMLFTLFPSPFTVLGGRFHNVNEVRIKVRTVIYENITNTIKQIKKRLITKL